MTRQCPPSGRGIHNVIRRLPMLFLRQLHTFHSVIAAKTGIQAHTGCRIEPAPDAIRGPGMTAVPFLAAGLMAMFILLYGAATSFAAVNDWAEGTQEKSDGATREYYNRAANLAWENYLGDWHDADDQPQGSRPYATADIEDSNTARYIEWDVQPLVQEWVDGRYANQGLLLHMISGPGPVNFRSKEYADTNQHPQLVIDTGTQNFTLGPVADTYLEPSTYRSMGDSDQLSLRLDGSNVLLRFDLNAIAAGTRITSATLRLYTHTQYGSATMVAGVFRCAQGEPVPHADPLGGIAAGYTDDIGITDHPDVIFATGFEAANWQDEWSYAAGTIDVVSEDSALQFSQLRGKALRAKIPEGENASMRVLYNFADKIGQEPEEIYFRYYLRFGDDWNQTVYGGKLPGISGTYDEAGWGGRKPDGTDGWSARGAYLLSISGDNPLSGTHPIGTYCYYADQPGTYGDTWMWTKEYKGFLTKNDWYCIEQFVRMNTPGVHNGIIRAWVDGRPAFEKEDIMFRTVDTLKIEQIWLDVYHGGKAVSPYDQHLYIDNVVIARQYIGPMNAIVPDPPETDPTGTDSTPDETTNSDTPEPPETDPTGTDDTPDETANSDTPDLEDPDPTGTDDIPDGSANTATGASDSDSSCFVRSLEQR